MKKAMAKSKQGYRTENGLVFTELLLQKNYTAPNFQAPKGRNQNSFYFLALPN